MGFVVGSSALLTLLLPFHEVTAEIASRTSPTILDLLVAVGCALAAAFTTVRPGSETASSAAGTAIGIALVPPLCVAGFGIGARAKAVAGGEVDRAGPARASIQGEERFAFQLTTAATCAGARPDPRTPRRQPAATRPRRRERAHLRARDQLQPLAAALERFHAGSASAASVEASIDRLHGDVGRLLELDVEHAYDHAARSSARGIG